MCFVNGNLFVMVECCAVCKGTVKAFFFSFIALSQDSCIFFFFFFHFILLKLLFTMGTAFLVTEKKYCPAVA